MIIAALAIYVVAVMRKKVHVVVDNEVFLERDFSTFKQLFDVYKLNEKGSDRPNRHTDKELTADSFRH